MSNPVPWQPWITPMIVWIGLASGCAPIYSPPIRSGHYGAAGRTQPDDSVEMMVSASTRATFGPEVGLTLADGLQLEGGADIKLSGDNGRWVIANAGLRMTTSLGDRPGRGFAFDAEGGLGAGAFGLRTRDPDDSQNLDRPAGGGYLGAGAAYHIASVVAPFVRVRAQGSKAEGYPGTFWWSTLGGVELDIADIVSLYLAYGPAGYVNTDDDEWWMYPEAGASCHF